MLCTERVGLPTSGVCPPLWQFLPRSDEKSADPVCFVPCAMLSRFSRVLPMFYSRSFIAFNFTFRSLIHFEFIFVYGVRNILISFSYI